MAKNIKSKPLTLLQKSVIMAIGPYGNLKYNLQKDFGELRIRPCLKSLENRKLIMIPSYLDHNYGIFCRLTQSGLEIYRKIEIEKYLGGNHET